MFDRHDELCLSSKSCSLMTTPSTIIKKQFDRSQLGLSMMIILATCSLILVLTLPIASFAQELCRGKMPTWKQRLCRDKTSTFQPSWCRFQNPFASVPFLFSDGRFPQLPSAESGIVCETSVSGVLSMLNGTIIGSGGDGSHPVISPRDKCKYITKINTLEFDRLPEGENRYVVFGLVSGEIVLVNFNKDKAFLAGKTSDRSTVQFMDAIAHNGSNILIATISKENAVSLFTGEMTGSPDSINACPYRQEPSHMQPLDVRFTVYMGKVYLGVLYYNHQDRKYRLRFNLLDGCEISRTQFLQFDILAPFTSNLSFRPFSQSGLFGNTFTTASAQKFRLLLQFTTKKHVKIVEFLPQNSSIYYHVDMTQVDSSSFYVAAEDEEITGATIANEFIRRIDLEKSTCENIVGNPSQGLNLVLTLKKPNYSHYLKARNLLEFGVYAFYNDTDRVFDNPAGRANTSSCSIVNGTFWNSETQKCQESFNIETKLEGFLENENVLEIRSRYYDVPSNFSFILNQDLTEMIDVEKTCTIGGVIIPQCEKLLNGSNCYFQALNKLGQLFVPQFLQDYMVNQIFISKSGKEILVYGLQQELCSMNALVMESYNKIRLVGESEFLEASSNAQHLFVTVWRERWELQSQQRFYNICQTLKSNPEDQFLKPFQSACSSTPEAIPVNLNHFGQYTSSCFSGMSCPSIRKVILNTVPEGHYTERPNAVKECEVSNFCVSGVQQPCPPGFMCPFKGMTKPIACSFDTVNTASDIDTREVSQWPGPKGSSTCARKGTSFPEPCPNGTFCITPYFPALPISPGLYIQDQSTIKKCEIGDYCNLGRFVVSGEDAATNQTSLKCPEQTYCENPSIVEPTVCIPTSNLSLYCPPGTSTRNLCAPGFYCPRPNQQIECKKTQYCPEGSFVPSACEAGFYCPTPAEQIVCPSGYYCVAGSILPSPCPLFSICKEGAKNYQDYGVGVLVDVSIILVVILVYKLYGWILMCVNKTKEKRRKKAQEAQLSKSLISQQENDTTDYEKDSISTVYEPLNPKLTVSDVMQGFYKQIGVEISFDKLCLELRTNNKRILTNVCGTFRPGRVSCIMGPSGSGKSTLLAALSDHAHYANVYGDIKINGVKASMKQFKNVCAFVTQDDFMNRQLTVEEAILFSARTRLNWSVSQKRLERLVDGVIQLLDLNEVRHSIIGDENKRGISGGQRKRVSIAMEFVACPYVLFLDEPTSSLDSYSSFEVAKSMKDIARSGITVVAVVHQPRYEIFQMFDDVILLGKGGRVAYAGPCSTAMDYFKNELQLECPPFVNPSDFFLDAIYDPQAAYRAQTERNSTTSSSQRKSTEFRGLTCDEIFQKWEMYQSKNSSAFHRNDDTSSHLSDNHSSSLNGHTESSYDILVKEEENRKQSALLHFIVCLYRSFSLKIRDIMSFFIDSLMVYISGLALGIIFLKETYTGPMPSELIQSCPVAIRSICEYPLNNPLINVASIVPLALGLCASMSSLSTFGTRQEQLVFKKERSSGLSTIAYFLAKNLEQLPNIVLGPLIFLSIFLCLYAPRASFGEYYYIILLMQFSAFGLGSLISVSIRMDLSQLASAVSVLVFQLVGGSKPTLPQMKSIFVPMYWFSCISYIRYCQEALYLVEIKYYKDTYDIKSSLELFGYDLDNFNFCVGMIPVFGIVFRILTLIMLYQLPDDSFLNIATMYFRYYSRWENLKSIPRKAKNYVKKKKQKDLH